MSPRASNLSSGARHYVASDDGDEKLATARAIKFGIAGASMPGHEWPADGDISLAELILSWRMAEMKAPRSAPKRETN